MNDSPPNIFVSPTSGCDLEVCTRSERVATMARRWPYDEAHARRERLVVGPPSGHSSDAFGPGADLEIAPRRRRDEDVRRAVIHARRSDVLRGSEGPARRTCRS